jgi:glutathione S-transferase
VSLTLHYFPTPNGKKVSIALEEMGLPYAVAIVDILRGEQTKPDFLAISPNGRIPAVVDVTPAGERVAIFESGAILQYLGRRSGMFYPQGEAARADVDAWVFWQMAGLGPMAGQLNWFRRATDAVGRDQRYNAYPLMRYWREVRRLYQVLERQLEGRDFICGDYSIADMACWPWVEDYGAQVGLAEFPNIDAWRVRIGQRPAVARALQVGLEAIRRPGAAR